MSDRDKVDILITTKASTLSTSKFYINPDYNAIHHLCCSLVFSSNMNVKRFT